MVLKFHIRKGKWYIRSAERWRNEYSLTPGKERGFGEKRQGNQEELSALFLKTGKNE
jgi:hypothetical protein